MLTTFKNFIQQHHLFSQDQMMLLAVSGGRDSVVLTHLMSRAGYKFAIAHCNFHIRPNDCDHDEQFVRSLAAFYNVPIHVAHFNTIDYSTQNHLSVEEAARNQRYQYFAELCATHGYARILTGHHHDDSIETFFINLLRGTGIAGLHGILPLQGNIARPLLPFSREQINAYVQDYSLEYVDDYTNDSDLYRRNQVRHKLLPILRELAPNINSAMDLTMGNLRQTEVVYQDYINLLRNQYCIELDGQIRVNRFEQLSSTVLYEILKPYGFNATQAADCLNPHHSGKFFYSSTHILTIERDHFFVQPIACQRIENPPSIVLKNWNLSEVSLTHLLHPEDGAIVQRDFIILDAETLLQPLNLRHWRVGDRFHPFGMKGTQLVSDFFATHKFSQQQKKSQWILVDANDDILWIVGHRASAHYPIKESSKSIIRVSVEY